MQVVSRSARSASSAIQGTGEHPRRRHMPIVKPTAPTFPTQDLTRTLDKLSDAAKSAQSADGSIDLRKLKESVKAAGAGAQSAFERIASGFGRDRTLSRL